MVFPSMSQQQPKQVNIDSEVQKHSDTMPELIEFDIESKVSNVELQEQKETEIVNTNDILNLEDWKKTKILSFEEAEIYNLLKQLNLSFITNGKQLVHYCQKLHFNGFNINNIDEKMTDNFLLNDLKWNKYDTKKFMSFVNFELFFNKIDLLSNKTLCNQLKSIVLLNNGLTTPNELQNLAIQDLKAFGFVIGDIIKMKNYFKNQSKLI